MEENKKILEICKNQVEDECRFIDFLYDNNVNFVYVDNSFIHSDKTEIIEEGIRFMKDLKGPCGDIIYINLSDIHLYIDYPESEFIKLMKQYKEN